jgi:hypothetical protein
MKDEEAEAVSDGRDVAVGCGGPIRRMKLELKGQHTNMSWKARSRVWIAAGLCAAATGSAAGGGYLAREGPPPLRFRRPLQPGVEKLALPPLALSSADTAVPTGSNADPDPLSTTAEPPEMGPTPPSTAIVPAPEPIVIPPAAMVSPTFAPGMPVTPQLLLSYFGAPGTNGVNPVVLAPVSFIPPQPGAPGSSRATYRQVP